MSINDLHTPTSDGGEPMTGTPNAKVEGAGGSMPWRRGFWSLWTVQFQGAFSDNTFKLLAIYIITLVYSDEADQSRLVPIVGALFALPFVVFSMAGGYMADRFSKRMVTIGTKFAETPVMLIGLLALSLQSIPLICVVVFLMSTQSAFFGPSKYGLVPELVPEPKLSWGNGLLSLGTFLASISGMIAAGVMADHLSNMAWAGVILVGLALFGLSASFGITKVPVANPNREFRANFVGDVWSRLREISKNRTLFLVVLGGAYFWFIASQFQFVLVIFGEHDLALSKTENSILLASLLLGIALGSFAAAYLSGDKIEVGLIPIGAAGLAVFTAMLSLDGMTYLWARVLLVLVGVSGGLFIVPINAMIQHLPPKESRGGVIATEAFLSWVAMLGSAGVFWVLKDLMGLSSSGVFLALGAIGALVTGLVAVLMPTTVLRIAVMVLSKTFYRLKVVGRDHIPEQGGALLVSNHMSFVDALLIMGTIERPIRFLMFNDIYDRRLIRPFAKIMGAIPIASNLRPRDMIRSLQEASDALKNGELVCVFAEGQISRIGQLLPFRRGYERILKDVEAPIIPVNLDGIWGSIFSFERGRFAWKRPRQVPFPVTVSFGKSLPPSAKPYTVRHAVQVLGSEAWELRKGSMRLLHESFIRRARFHPGRFFCADSSGGNVLYGDALIRTILLAKRLDPLWTKNQHVGICLPPSVAATLVNFAAMLLGKVPVNLNYTLDRSTMNACMDQCGIKKVLTSRKFVEQARLGVDDSWVFIEDYVDPGSFSGWEKLSALVVSRLVPCGLLQRLVGNRDRRDIDSVATVIFSSGSTGVPKGVPLSHYNIASNIEQMSQVFALEKRDRLLGVLPFFHSFGFTATFALPATLGAGVVFHPNPLDGRTVGAMVEKHAVTFLLATPTFLQLYSRCCTPEQFGSLNYVVTGAEKLSERLADQFEEKFGIRPLEAYGCTECSPAVTVNCRDYRAAGFRQIGVKRGTIGHPLPGISVRIADPDTMEDLGPGRPGLLLVKGPNVMCGYLGRDDLNDEVLRDGWYVTGDIAQVDEDGFLRITDRLSRFSKIGGEMVPHIKIEEKLHALAGRTEQSFVVSAVEDAKKGEKLVVLTTLDEADRADVVAAMAQSDLPNLWKPRADLFFTVPSFPMLGSGKLDLKEIKRVAATRAESV